MFLFLIGRKPPHIVSFHYENNKSFIVFIAVYVTCPLCDKTVFFIARFYVTDKRNRYVVDINMYI